MLLSAHQPAYLCWPGYLDKIRQADVFVVLDTVQRSHGDWSNRNRIKTANGPLMLSIPLLGSRQQYFYEIMTADNGWKNRHKTTIFQAYSRVIPDSIGWHLGFEQLYAETDNLVHLADRFLRWLLRGFEIDTPILYASDLNWESDSPNLSLIKLCKELGADEFLFGSRGRDYCVEKYWDEAGIRVHFQNYQPKEYPQLHGDFIPGLSALDLLLNCGEGAKDFL